MKKFEHISTVYDWLFPARPEQLDFLQNALPEGLPARWVDLACGTGQHLQGLARRGLEVWGLDLEEEMLQQLWQRAPELQKRTVVADMRWADRELGPQMSGPAGVVYCIGNALVQLVDLEDIRSTLRAVHELLASGGALVVQVVNFDRVLSGDLNLLPRIERSLPDGEAVALERRYTPSNQPGCLEFRTRLSTAEGAVERTHTLRALTRDELQALLEGSGFEPLQWDGDYLGSPWSPASPATIVRAIRS